MYKQFRMVLDLLSPQERNRLLLLVPMMLGGAIIDSLGVASIMPFIAVLANPDVIKSNIYLKYAYDSLGFASEIEYMRFLAGVFLVFLVLATAYKALLTYVMARYALMREYSIGREMVSRYFAQPYDWFLNRHSTDLGKTVLTEVSRVVGTVITPLIQVFVQSAIVLSLLILLVVVQPKVAMTIGSALVSAYGTIYFLQRSYLRKIGSNIERANRIRFRVVNEGFSGIKSVKVSALEPYYSSMFAESAFEFARNITASNIATQLPRYALELLAFGGMIGVIFFLMQDYGNFQSMLSILAVYALAGYRLMPAVQQVYMSMATLRVGGPILERLHAEFTSLKVSGISLPRSLVSFEQEICLESIGYKYPTSFKMNISNVNITIPFCKSIGIVGVTGSGKTTVIDMILGLLQPVEGHVLVDGKEISESNRTEWQRLIGYVPQQIFLTDATIAANIAYGVPDHLIDQQALIQAAKMANLHDFVVSELPEAYSTVVGERGVRLSGGQIQRIGIARALYRRPRLLVLDEATSALDNLTEAAVMEGISNLGHQITIVMVAHRISTVRDCDCIYVMEHGRVIDCGGYDELSARSSLFRGMAGRKERSFNPNSAISKGL